MFILVSLTKDIYYPIRISKDIKKLKDFNSKFDGEWISLQDKNEETLWQKKSGDLKFRILKIKEL